MLVAGFGFGFGFGSTLSITSLQNFHARGVWKKTQQTVVVLAQVGTCAHLALSITCNFLPCDWLRVLLSTSSVFRFPFPLPLSTGQTTWRCSQKSLPSFMGPGHAMDGFTFRLITPQIIYYSQVFLFRRLKLLYLGRVT